MSSEVKSYFDYAVNTILDENQDSKKQEICIFDNPDFGQIRVVMRDGSPWFVAKDVCDCLDVDSSNLSKTLDDDEKGVVQYTTPGGIQPMVVTSEPGLYSLILRSRKLDAKRFKRWVTHDVLPTIRKTGTYSIAGIPVPRFDSPADAARAWADLFEAKVIAEKKAALETARADLAIATKGQIVQGRDSRLMQQRHEDIKALNRKDERNGKLEAMYAEQGIKLGAERARADKAEDAIGVGKTYRCAINIPWFKDYFDFKNCKADQIYKQAGKQLKALSDEMGYAFVTVPGHKFDVKAYHIDVIAAFRLRLDANPSLMQRWRKKD